MAANDYPGATTGKDLIATAFFAHSTDLLRRTRDRCSARTDDAARYADQLARIKAAFRREFVTEERPRRRGHADRVRARAAVRPAAGGAATAWRPGSSRRTCATRKHLTTGFLGTPYLCHVLSRYGYLDEAYLLLNREDYPSWLYPVKQGATTIWERWDGQKPDGSFQTTEMNSFNHYAYGAIGDWMYRVMAGIEIDEAAPGYKHILIQPRPGGGFTSVKASHKTPYGKVGSAWTLRDGRFELTVEVPPNTSATVRLPKAQVAKLLESGKPIAEVEWRHRPPPGRRRGGGRDRLRPVPVCLWMVRQLTPVTVGIVPKSTRNPYFQDCHRGAREAAAELGFELRWDGPERADPAHQARLVAQWMEEGIPVLAVSVESSIQLTPALKAARLSGTKVLTWDSDAAADARDFTIVHATSESVAHALAFEIVRILGGSGSFAAHHIDSLLSQPEGVDRSLHGSAREGLPRPHPGRSARVQRFGGRGTPGDAGSPSPTSGPQGDRRFCSPAVPGAAEALKEAGRDDIRVTGVSLPSLCRRHIEEGAVDSVVIWKTRNLGYLVGASAHALATGSLRNGAASFRAGRLGNLVVLNDEIRLGRCHIVTRGNIAEFD